MAILVCDVTKQEYNEPHIKTLEKRVICKAVMLTTANVKNMDLNSVTQLKFNSK
jgi:hypothetical protein